eukprot:c13684_g1_i1.p1 GENE.c13684_g1_i1~~c13684_g1_i1.p1  ORF type:complete len:148 (+),score=34.24 c13684_g1_i1:61-504(+)
MERQNLLSSPLSRTFVEGEKIHIIERESDIPTATEESTHKILQMLDSIDISARKSATQLVEVMNHLKQQMDWVTAVSVQHTQTMTQEVQQIEQLVKTEVLRAKFFLAKMQELNNEAQNLSIIHAQLKDLLRLISYLEAAADRLIPAK